MKVLFINRVIGMFRGGGENFDLNIARELRKYNVEIRFLASKPVFGNVKYPITDFISEYVPSPYLRDLAQAMSIGEPFFEKVPISPVRELLQKLYKTLPGCKKI